MPKWKIKKKQGEHRYQKIIYQVTNGEWVIVACRKKEDAKTVEKALNKN